MDILLAMLSSDGPLLESYSTRIQELRERLSQITVVNLGDQFGYDDETFRRADEGGEAATKRMLTAMMLGQSSPLALSGSLLWPYWLLRFVGAGSYQAMSHALGAIQVQREQGMLAADLATQLRVLIESYPGPGPVDPAISASARALVAGREPDASAVDAFLIHDAVASGDDVTTEQLSRGVALAERVDREYTETGAVAYFRMLLADRSRRLALPYARREANTALEAAARLAATDTEYTELLGKAASVAAQLAWDAGDRSTAEDILRRHGDAIETVIASQNE